ncbi:hypothetical protein [Clostridium merdae]|uniref:hypothetical protein n=1 Tax=Clostridium merdae TaxID=1958780 RepID=UPI000A26DCB4|nr:hypothetical protein [Clostridium merdae]
MYPKRKDMEPAFQKIVDRLGRYEDTGLAPEQINAAFLAKQNSKKLTAYLPFGLMGRIGSNCFAQFAIKTFHRMKNTALNAVKN